MAMPLSTFELFRADMCIQSCKTRTQICPADSLSSCLGSNKDASETLLPLASFGKAVINTFIVIHVQLMRFCLL